MQYVSLHCENDDATGKLKKINASVNDNPSSILEQHQATKCLHPNHRLYRTWLTLVLSEGFSKFIYLAPWCWAAV